MKDQLTSLIGVTTDFFTVLLVVGVLSMALIQIIKDVLPARRLYQQGWLRRWVGRKLGPGAGPEACNAVFDPSNSSDESGSHPFRMQKVRNPGK